MTAAPAHLPLFTTAPSSSFLSPASFSASDLSFDWTAMSPREEGNARPRRKASQSPATPANEEPAENGGFIFVTAEKPADFKSKSTMTTVRKKAMDAFLKGDKKTGKTAKSSGTRSRISSRSRSSVGHDDAFTDISTMPTTVSQSAPSVTRTKASSPTRSSIAPSSHDPDAQSASGTVARTQRFREFVLEDAPLVAPARDNVPLPYDAYQPGPFVSIGTSLDPFRTMFQSSHPGVSVEQLKFHCSRYFGTRGLGRHWIPTALSYPHTFLGTLCLATAYHDVIHEQPLESVQTIALRQEVIHLVGRNMLDPKASVSDHNLMAIIQLIISEVIGREESGLSWHENGIETMVKQRGGLNQLGVNGYLASSIAWVSLASSILREAPPRSIYLDYCTANSRKNYAPTAPIPESPIYCPRGSFKTLQRSPRCTTKAQEVLVDVRMMIDIFLHETKTSRRNSQTLMNLYRKIISPAEYPPVTKPGRTEPLSKSDWKYEAIRLACIIQATAIIQRLPLSDALTHAAEVRAPNTLQTAFAMSTSYESPVSPFDQRLMTPLTEAATSPSFAPFSAGPAIPQSYFPTVGPRSSTSSVNAPRPSFSSTSSAARPSVSSTYSSSSEQFYFAPPPPPAQTKSTTLLKDLKTAIEQSNVSDCWADMAGVLLWIGLVVGAASKNSESKLHKKYFSALTMRAGVMLFFEHPEAISATMLRMGEVVEALAGEAKPKSPSADEGNGKGKKRRV
ncbi:hypothetical protein FB567DRAFT_46089 [Paraphoma chrysanthemicola]|uniref:Tachykinin family protein n=1 Tax=Paraphoma chrysanthemicola TaxID=798071 RepID=A0A8K0RIH7_9PLEO|nr:hypothetical protein FB567DRAFT_46089 [Paraphoma chrysanthemicola]